MMQIGLVSLLAMVSIVSAAADPLAAARWKSGILIVFSPNAADAKLAEQRGIFKRAHTGMFERHVILLEAVGNNASSHTLRQRVGATGKDFRALLIGKDGHTAMSSAEPLTSEVLFRAIDAMPKTRSADYIRASGYERRINRAGHMTCTRPQAESQKNPMTRGRRPNMTRSVVWPASHVAVLPPPIKALV